MSTLLVHLPAALLVIFRIGGLMLFAPVLGSNIVPLRLRILLAFVLGAAIYPVLVANYVGTMVSLSEVALGLVAMGIVAMVTGINLLGTDVMIRCDRPPSHHQHRQHHPRQHD